MMRVDLPWPDRDLHPNARAHWSVRAKAARQAREFAAWAAKAAGVRGWVRDGEISVCVAFYPPDRRKRDLDGCLASIKSHLDGIADALGVDDSRFALSLRMCWEQPGAGMVRVEIKP